jgi:hypothetical protein
MSSSVVPVFFQGKKMRSNLDLDITSVPFQPNHITVKVAGDRTTPTFSLEINPGTVPNYRVGCKLTRSQLAGINNIVTAFLKDGTS